MPGTGQQIGRFPVDLIAQVDEAIEQAGGLESRIEYVVAATRARLAAEGTPDAYLACVACDWSFPIETTAIGERCTQCGGELAEVSGG